MKTLTPQESALLYTWLKSAQDLRAILVQVLFETGARTSEALALHGGLLSGTTLEIPPLKGSLPRTVSISEGLASRLRQLPAGTWGELAFPGAARASQRRLLCRYFHLLTEDVLGRRRNLHALRHTAFSRVYRATQDLLLTKSWAGHRAISSTVVYMEAVAQDRGSAINLTALEG